MKSNNRQIHRDRYHIAKEVLFLVMDTRLNNHRQGLSIRYAINLTYEQTVTYLNGLLNDELLTLTKSRNYRGTKLRLRKLGICRYSLRFNKIFKL